MNIILNSFRKEGRCWQGIKNEKALLSTLKDTRKREKERIETNANRNFHFAYALEKKNQLAGEMTLGVQKSYGDFRRK